MECLDVLENLEVGDATVQHCFRPGSSSTFHFEKPLQFLPKLSLTDSSRFFRLFDLSAFGTPDSLGYYLD